jgi:hypothetical protein
MLRASLIAIFIIALSFGQIQCITACALQVCAPPCHKQGACFERGLDATAVAVQPLPAPAPVVMMDDPVPESPAVSAPVRESRLAPSPPGFERLSSIVLRI